MIFPLTTFSQLNKVDKIFEKIQENDFKKVIDLNNKLKDETPIVLRNFVNHLIYNDIDYLDRNVDSAYFYLQIVSKEFKVLETTLKNEYCMRFQLCAIYLNTEKLKLENEAYFIYSKDSSIVSLNFFIEYFNNDELKQKASKLIERLEFNNVVKINSLEGYKQFLAKYPKTIYKAEIINYLSELEFNVCLKNEKEECYREYLKSFPDSKNSIQAKKNLRGLLYKNAIEAKTIEKYEQFLAEYLFDKSYKSDIIDIQDRLCYLKYLNIKNSINIDSVLKFVWKFESCKYGDSAKVLLERLEYSFLQNNFSIIRANSFLKNHPLSSHKKEVLIKLFELEFPLIMNTDDNSKTDGFREKYQEIGVEDKLSKIGSPIIYTCQINGEKKYGFINSYDSNIVVYPMYDDVRSFSNGLAAVQFNNLWGFVDKTGNIIIDIEYEDVRDFHEGFAGVKTDGLWMIINKSNSPISNQKYQNVGIFNTGLINVSTLTSGWVYISSDGQIQSKGLSYLSATSFDSGYAFVQEESRYFIIDAEFKKLYEVDYNSPLYNNYTILDACSGFEVGHTSNVLCNFHKRRNPYSIKKYGDALLLNEGLVYDIKRKECWISEDIFFDKQILVIGNRRTERSQQAMLYLYLNEGKEQSINVKQNSYGNAEFVKISRVKNNIVLQYSSYETNSIRIQSITDVKTEKYTVVNNNGQWHFEDKNKIILGNKMDYTYASEFLNERSIVGVSNKYLLIDTNAVQYGAVYDRIIRLNSRLFVVCLNRKCFLMDLNGNYISKGYDYMDSRIYDGTIIVTVGDLNGYIDLKGNEIIKPQFTDARGFSNGKAIVTFSYGNTNCNNWDCKGTRVIDKKGIKVNGDFKKFLKYNPFMRF